MRVATQRTRVMVKMESPSTEIVWPPHSSAKLRLIRNCSGLGRLAAMVGSGGTAGDVRLMAGSPLGVHLGGWSQLIQLRGGPGRGPRGARGKGAGGGEGGVG